jgi:hypothetical protein
MRNATRIGVKSPWPCGFCTILHRLREAFETPIGELPIPASFMVKTDAGENQRARCGINAVSGIER